MFPDTDPGFDYIIAIKGGSEFTEFTTSGFGGIPGTDLSCCVFTCFIAMFTALDVADIVVEDPPMV